MAYLQTKLSISVSSQNYYHYLQIASLLSNVLSEVLLCIEKDYNYLVGIFKTTNCKPTITKLHSQQTTLKELHDQAKNFHTIIYFSSLILYI